MKFYCINSNESNGSYLAFKDACQRHKVDFVGLDPLNTNILDLNVEKGDLVYRVSANKRNADFLEKEILHKGAIGFYRDPSLVKILGKSMEAYFNNQELASPKTISVLTNNKEILKKYVDYLGGFPIILKVLGGSKGIGVMKIESFESLLSIVDYFESQLRDKEIILREFIEHDKHIRVIVLGEEVLFSYLRFRSSDDFRTNFRDNPEKIKKEVFKLSDEIKKIAVNAVKNMNLEFGGVDILIQNKTEKPFLAEVNSPCSLKVAGNLAGEENLHLEEKMLNFLINKSKKLN